MGKAHKGGYQTNYVLANKDGTVVTTLEAKTCYDEVQIFFKKKKTDYFSLFFLPKFNFLLFQIFLSPQFFQLK
jgi:hypothetical protein